MDFDEYAQQIHAEDFFTILNYEGKMYGEMKLNISKEDLLDSIFSLQEKFQKAEGICICLSHDFLELGEDSYMKIFDLLYSENIDSFFIKQNKTLKCKDGLYGYQIIFTGLE